MIQRRFFKPTKSHVEVACHQRRHLLLQGSPRLPFSLANLKLIATGPNQELKEEINLKGAKRSQSQQAQKKEQKRIYSTHLCSAGVARKLSLKVNGHVFEMNANLYEMIQQGCYRGSLGGRK